MGHELVIALQIQEASTQSNYWLSAGASADRISRGTVRMAIHLRVRQTGRLLLGQFGVVPAVVAWVLLAVVAALALIFGGVILLAGLAVAAAVIVVLARTGVQTHWSHFVLLASLIVGAASEFFKRNGANGS